MSDTGTGADGRPPDAFPRLHHWLIAAITLFVMGIIVPLFAAFI